jgi:DNA-binding transcriptional regulator YdaS (Cro superfamily)
MSALSLSDRFAAIEKLLREKSTPGENGCILWTGYRQPNGYGWINIGQFHIAAHRAALIVSGVEVPDGSDVCHRCDVRPCINPDHLYSGTRRQNMADCTARGRHNKPSGETHWCAKLSALDVARARRAVQAGISQSEVARQLGVHHSTISRIARGIWRTEVTL